MTSFRSWFASNTKQITTLPWLNGHELFVLTQLLFLVAGTYFRAWKWHESLNYRFITKHLKSTSTSNAAIQHTAYLCCSMSTPPIDILNPGGKASGNLSSQRLCIFAVAVLKYTKRCKTNKKRSTLRLTNDGVREL